VRFSGPRAVEAPTAEKVRDRLTSWMEHGSPKPDPHWIPIRRSRRPIGLRTPHVTVLQPVVPSAWSGTAMRRCSAW